MCGSASPTAPVFSDGTSFTSVALLRNGSDAPQSVKPSISFIYNNAPRTINLAARYLLAQQVDAIDIGAALKRAGIRGLVSGAGLTLTSAGNPGALVAHLTSYDQTRSHAFDVPLKDPVLPMNRFGGSYPWTLEGDTLSVIHVRNTTDEPSRFTIELDWEGGSYALPIEQLDPHQEAAIDIRKLRDSQEEDSIGRVIPKDLTRGQANWSEHGQQALIGRTEVFSVSAGVASSFSCGENCCLPSTFSVSMSPTSMTGPVGGSGLMKLLEMRKRACDGLTSGPFNVTIGASWLSMNPAVATLGTPSPSGCPVNWVGVGQCNIHSLFEGVTNSWDFVDGHCVTNPSSFTADGPVTVASVKITLDGTDITGTSRDVIVGQKISVTAAVQPAGATTTNRKWTIPGVRIANYVVTYTTPTSPTSAIVTALAANPTGSTVDFYWVDGADGRQVQISLQVNGVSFTAVATFNVKRPTATVSISTGTVQFTDFGFGLGMFLGSPTQPGISLSANVAIPSGFTGQTQWVQIWHKFRRVRSATSGRWSRSSGVGLDSAYPYSSADSANDSPGLSFATLNAVIVDESYEMYWMFKPTGLSVPTIWVPFKVIDWSWAGDASFNGSSWVTNSSRNPSNLQATDTGAHPTWTQNAANIPFTIEQ